MLAELPYASLATLNLKLVDHASLLSRRPEDCAAVFARDDHCCHRCGFRVRGYMEIDHMNGHAPDSGQDELKTICQFCHNLRHPLWAASRQRFIPIFAPDISQEDLHRLAWVIVAWRDDEASNDGNLSERISQVQDAILGRRTAINKILGSTNIEALMEVVMGLASHLPKKDVRAGLMRIDQYVRFFPAEALPDADALPAASRLSTWDLGGFRPVADAASAVIRDEMKPDFDILESTARKFTAKAN